MERLMNGWEGERRGNEDCDIKNEEILDALLVFITPTTIFSFRGQFLLLIHFVVVHNTTAFQCRLLFSPFAELLCSS